LAIRSWLAIRRALSCLSASVLHVTPAFSRAVAAARSTAQRLERSLMSTPSPSNAGTARPADLSGQIALT
jgi:hypothetical protein